MTNGKKRAKDPKRTEAIKYAYWNKWCPGGDPSQVVRSKGITKDPWTITNVTNTTPEKFDNPITKAV